MLAIQRFLQETWALDGIGTAILLLRFAVRFKTIGIRRLQFDDLFVFLVLIFYACDAATVHLVYFLGTNVEASTIQTQRELSADDVADFTLGSKLQLCPSRSHLDAFQRRGIGKLYQIPETCIFKLQNLLVTTILNVLTDGAMLCIPLPLLWKLQVPFRQKLVIGILLSSGIFVMAVALIRLGFSLSSNPSAANVSWDVRETIVGIITVNIPILRPMFNRSFWTPGLSPPGSERRTKSGTGTGTRIKSTHISAHMPEAFEMTTGKSGHMNNYTRYRSSTDGDSSEEGILRDPQPPSVLVSTSYEVRSELDPSEAAWDGRANKVSIHARHNIA
ncbi:hypothetical protein V2G26_003799 [Clonostachys chloroleuca]